MDQGLVWLAGLSQTVPKFDENIDIIGLDGAGLPQMLHPSRKVSLLLMDGGQVHNGFYIVAAGGDGVFERGGSFVKSAPLFQNVAQIVPGAGMVGFDRHRFLEVFQG